MPKCEYSQDTGANVGCRVRDAAADSFLAAFLNCPNICGAYEDVTFYPMYFLQPFPNYTLFRCFIKQMPKVFNDSNCNTSISKLIGRRVYQLKDSLDRHIKGMEKIMQKMPHSMIDLGGHYHYEAKSLKQCTDQQP